MTKRYDKAYFDKWYRGGGAINTTATVRRKVHLAVSIAEYFLERQIRTVLDIGCGEGAWLGHLRTLRPKVRYSGIDASRYAVRRFGKSRNIIEGGFGDLGSLPLRGPFDLIVCSDVLHYVTDADIMRGLPAMAELCRGAAFLEVLTKEDDIIGDLDGLIQRPAAWYRVQLRRVGMVFVGAYCWLSQEAGEDASKLQRA